MSVPDRDAGLLWHPYAPLTEHGASSALAEVTGAEGARLRVRTAEGRERWVVDGMASWWSAIHGYRHPVLDAAAHAQIDRFSHVMFGGLTHAPAVELAERLATLSPATPHVFLADSGSVSVEVALKLAVQHQAALAGASTLGGGSGRPGRRRMLALEGGYHGDTTGAMGVTDPHGGMHREFTGLVASHVFAPRPPALGAGPEAVAVWAEQTRALAARHAEELAGVICEPLVQGAGGMHVYEPECLRVLRQIADELGVVLIADEIATGFWRTGSLFACEAAGVTPDVRCVGKALTGGYMTLAAVLVSSAVAETISGSNLRALMHGPTFMGNPLACAVASASLDLLDAAPEPARAAVTRIERRLREGLSACAALPGVREVRVQGAIGVVQLDEAADTRRLGLAALEEGAWIRPFRDLVYVMPPYVASDDDLRVLTAAIHSVLSDGTVLSGGTALSGEPA